MIVCIYLILSIFQVIWFSLQAYSYHGVWIYTLQANWITFGSDISYQLLFSQAHLLALKSTSLKHHHCFFTIFLLKVNIFCGAFHFTLERSPNDFQGSQSYPHLIALSSYSNRIIILLLFLLLLLPPSLASLISKIRTKLSKAFDSQDFVLT